MRRSRMPTPILWATLGRFSAASLCSVASFSGFQVADALWTSRTVHRDHTTRLASSFISQYHGGSQSQALRLRIRRRDEKLRGRQRCSTLFLRTDMHGKSEMCNDAGTDACRMPQHLEAFDECWRATAWTIRPNDGKEMLPCFQSPAPQVYFALDRALNLPDALLGRANLSRILHAFTYLLKRDRRFLLRNDGSCEWKIVPLCQLSEKEKREEGDLVVDSDWTTIEPDLYPFQHTAEIAREVLRVVTERYKSANEYLEEEEEARFGGHCAGNGKEIAQGRGDERFQAEIDQLVSTAMQRLDWTLGTDIRGRASADAAFFFSMAGVSDPILHEKLAKVSQLELDRTGFRPSFLAKHILQHIEKLAASGASGPTADAAYHAAARCLESKGYEHSELRTLLLHRRHHRLTQDNDRSSFGLHSTRPLLWLWRFSARQTKAKQRTKCKALPDKAVWSQQLPVHSTRIDTTTSATIGTSTAPLDGNTDSIKQKCRQIDFDALFDDTTRPLIVDLGSGMGVSLLGLATLPTNASILQNCAATDSLLLPTAGAFNFIGGELNTVLCRYSQGIAKRWGLTGRVGFVPYPAEAMLQQIDDRYPGVVDMLMVQFPTPYRMGRSDSEVPNEDVAKDTKTHHNGGSQMMSPNNGNAQLPSSVRSKDFMANAQLLKTAAAVLRRSKEKGGHAGLLLLQSNCEDVAVNMRKMAVEEIGFTIVDMDHPVDDNRIPDDNSTSGAGSNSNGDGSKNLPQRTLEWIHRGGQRARGPGWASQPLLPRRGQTETEVVCELQGTAVHRCLLRMV